MSGSARRVIPFVEDRRNCLLLEPDEPAHDPIRWPRSRRRSSVGSRPSSSSRSRSWPPSRCRHRDERRLLMFYESAEGGAGVLRRLVDDPAKLGRGRPRGPADLPLRPRHRRGSASRARCDRAMRGGVLRLPAELLQPARPRLLDRHAIKAVLVASPARTVARAGGALPPDEHLETLRVRADSDLERRFLTCSSPGDGGCRATAPGADRAAQAPARTSCTASSASRSSSTVRSTTTPTSAATTTTRPRGSRTLATRCCASTTPTTGRR